MASVAFGLNHIRKAPASEREGSSIRVGMLRILLLLVAEGSGLLAEGSLIMNVISAKRRRLELEHPISMSMVLDAHHLPAGRVLRAAACSAAHGGKRSHRTLRNHFREQLYAVSNAETPYGKIVKEIVIFDGPRRMAIEYVCPFSFLCVMSSASSLFDGFLADNLKETSMIGRAIFYNDALTPSNNLRPDHGR